MESAIQTAYFAQPTKFFAPSVPHKAKVTAHQRPRPRSQLHSFAQSRQQRRSPMVSYCSQSGRDTWKLSTVALELDVQAVRPAPQEPRKKLVAPPRVDLKELSYSYLTPKLQTYTHLLHSKKDRPQTACRRPRRPQRAAPRPPSAGPSMLTNSLLFRHLNEPSLMEA